MFQVFAHTKLLHQFVLITIHACQFTNVSEYILKTVGKLKRVHIAQTILYMRVNDKLGQAQNFTTQMKRIAKSRLLTLFRRQRLHRLQVKVVVQMEIVEVSKVETVNFPTLTIFLQLYIIQTKRESICLKIKYDQFFCWQ